MRWIHAAILAACICGLPLAGLADGGIIVGDDGSIGGGGGEEPGEEGHPSDAGMTAMDATAKHLAQLDARLEPGAMPTAPQPALEHARAVSAYGHELVRSIHQEGLRGRELVEALTSARSELHGPPGALAARSHGRPEHPGGRSESPGRSAEHRP